MKKLILCSLLLAFMWACGAKESKTESTAVDTTAVETTSAVDTATVEVEKDAVDIESASEEVKQKADSLLEKI